MITQPQLEQVSHSLKRIFALPISRMTVREVQDALKNAFPNNLDLTNAVYTSLLAGKIDDKLFDDTDSKVHLKQLINDYSPTVRLAKDIAEMGEFMNIFSCDFLQQGNQVFFVNRMRRLDAQEYYFLSAPETNIRLAHMFINRLRDLKEATKGATLDKRIKDELESIKKDIDALLES